MLCGMFAAFRDTMRRWADSTWVLPALAVASFLASIIVPIPLEAILVPLMQARRRQIWLLAGLALVGCIAGALVGYYVGYFLMETAGHWLLDWLGGHSQLQRGRELMDRHGFWFIVGVSVVPVPFQIAMLAAGAARYPVMWYLLATLLSRGIRYFGLGLLVYLFGDQTENLMKHHKIKAILGGTLLIVGLWALTTWLGEG